MLICYGLADPMTNNLQRSLVLWGLKRTTSTNWPVGLGCWCSLWLISCFGYILIQCDLVPILCHALVLPACSVSFHTHKYVCRCAISRMDRG